MKRIILLLMISISSYSYGQRFVLTPNGLRDSLDTEKSYIVISVEGKTAKQLYDNAIKFINKTYKNPSDVIKGQTDSEYLKYESHVSDFISFKNSFLTAKFDVDYTTELNFRDGKVKFEIINLDMNKRTQNGINRLLFIGNMMSLGIYNKKGDLKIADAKIQIENFFNIQVNQLSNDLNENNKQADNW
ncbi:MAG TPA: DUF4468 domain-containing protein [Paludibacter sp.]